MHLGMSLALKTQSLRVKTMAAPWGQHSHQGLQPVDESSLSGASDCQGDWATVMENESSEKLGKLEKQPAFQSDIPT